MCLILSLRLFKFIQNVLGVTLGGTIGHALCTGLAVIGGRLVAQRISVKTGKNGMNVLIKRCFISKYEVLWSLEISFGFSWMLQ